MSETFKKLQMSEFFDVSSGCISKIELNPSFILSSDNTNYKNDIQYFSSCLMNIESMEITINTSRCYEHAKTVE